MSPSQQWEFPGFTKVIHRSTYPAISSTNPANSAAGKVVVVTGGGTAIGRGIAHSFATAGARIVAIIGRRAAILASTKAELEASSGGKTQILTYAVDILDESGLNAAFADIANVSGSGIDVCVANAGLAVTQHSLAGTVDAWWQGFEVNVKGSFITFRAFAATKAKENPIFISVNSGAAHLGSFPNLSSYTASKMALAHLLPSLQVENPEIRCVAFHPGVIESDMNSGSGIVLSLDDVSLPADFALWLASDKAAWTKGKFLWAHWDVEELEGLSGEIEEKGELVMGLKGWPREVEVEVRV
nr:hypothetical protein B0A51_14565 [Rachicladosporium sp. CCFEE 5018]